MLRSLLLAALLSAGCGRAETSPGEAAFDDQGRPVPILSAEDVGKLIASFPTLKSEGRDLWYALRDAARAGEDALWPPAGDEAAGETLGRLARMFGFDGATAYAARARRLAAVLKDAERQAELDANRSRVGGELRQIEGALASTVMDREMLQDVRRRHQELKARLESLPSRAESRYPPDDLRAVAGRVAEIWKALE